MEIELLMNPEVIESPKVVASGNTLHSIAKHHKTLSNSDKIYTNIKPGPLALLSKPQILEKSLLMETSPVSPANTEERTLECDKCKTLFKNNNALRRHLRSVHIDPEPCPYCTKLMKSQGRPDNNRKHLMRCHGFLDLVKNISENRQKELLHYIVRELTAGRGNSLLNK
eukprot:NODE_822_length_3913_cov_0.283167.p2 type:complete len:169 gc:universal NODE_822_length_3913_cov_0.283167:2647-2141(-)